MDSLVCGVRWCGFKNKKIFWMLLTRVACWRSIASLPHARVSACVGASILSTHLRLAHSLPSELQAKVSDAWGAYARDTLSWQRPFDVSSLVDLEKGLIAWYLGGKLNASGMRSMMMF